MASQERLEYFISAAFKDEGVRQAMQSFAKLNAESAKVVRELENISKAANKAGASIRDSRTGFAQVGMQINQFGTQVASGTSMTTAFVQQIGDVGWALSGMGGILGRVGAFLAGPWGVAVMGAAFALQSLFNTTEDGNKVNEEFQKATKSSQDALFNYRVETAATREELLKLYETQLAGIEIKWREAATNVGIYGREVRVTNEALKSSGLLSSMGALGLVEYFRLKSQATSATEAFNKAQIDERDLQTQLINAQTTLFRLKKGFAAEDARASAKAERAADKEARAADAAARKAAQQLENELGAFDRLSSKLLDVLNLKTAGSEAIGRAKNELADFEKLLADLTTATVGGQPIGAQLLGQFAPQIAEVKMGLEDAAAGMQEWLVAIPGQSDAATKAFNDQKDAIDAVGMSVNDAFKGMLTAGMSWKDGMKGIINAVINELWRLFVVQQIVGMVSKFVGGFLGGGPVTDKMGGGTLISDFDKAFGNNANGTPSWKGGLTWVGERGPELVNLPRGSGVIPAHRASQMGGGGGINITVDARGSADPAAVRAQVQQGILEAAPAIVAAAQQRTVAGLRRPKLGGVMQ